MRKLFLLLLFAPVIAEAQCDLSIVDVNLNTYEVTVAVDNSDGCSGGTVSMLMIGFHVPGNEIAIDLEGDCFMNPSNSHVGWWYGPLATPASNNWPEGYGIDDPLVAGDTVILPLDNPSGVDCVNDPILTTSLGCCAAPLIDYYLAEEECIEFVIWQVNYSPSWYIADGGWATGNNDGVSPFVAEYPDMDCNNSWYTCREDNPGGPVGSTICSDTICSPLYLTDTVYTELPADTVYLTEVDTIVEYIYLEADTVYTVELDTLVLVDSVYFPVFLYDTTYIYVSDTIVEYEEVYVYQTDTIYEYEVIEFWVDCFTGLECVNEPPGMAEDCGLVWVPNTFSPNNDGINDEFYVTSGSDDCWLEWNLSIYNRWGNIVWSSNNPEQGWYGESNNGEYYAEDEVYVWSLRAVGLRSKTIQLSGSVTLLR